jgi:malonyl CoA-acyl carrier protein transacylase
MNATMKSVWMFPGQGSQHKGMGEGLFERYPQLVEQADRVLGYSLRELCLEDPDGVLDRTEYTQPALFAVSALSFLARRDDGATLPDAYAGHSLGEFAALFAAGAFDFATGLALVAKRGALMAAAPRGAMAAIIGLERDAVSAVLASSGLEAIDIANINSATQIVVSGLYDDIARSEAAFAAAGARFIPLKVSAAFHSRYMRDVEAQFAEFAAGYSFAALNTDVIANRTARPHDRAAYLPQLIEQISHPVEWYASISWLLAQNRTGDGIDIEEIGPGSVLTGLFAKIRKTPLPLSLPETASPGASSHAGPAGKAKHSSAASAGGSGTRTVFMFSGKGSHYYGMGQELYRSNDAFRTCLDECNAIYTEMTDRDMVAELYDEANRWREMTDIQLSHPALYSVSYSLAVALRAGGVEPDCVLGYSLGEYVAATVAGAFTRDDALRTLVRQAEFLHKRSARGGMLSVLAPVTHFETHPDIYRNTVLASVNFDRNFVVSGAPDAIEAVAASLNAQSVAFSRLPVDYAFHSPMMAELEPGFRSIFDGLPVSRPELPLYSCAAGGRIQRVGADHLWKVTRDPLDFRAAIDALVAEGRARFVDAGPAGTLAGFVKHGYGTRLEHVTTINQFGRNAETLAGSLMRLAA